MRKKTTNPADRVVRARLREPVQFPDLTERQALKLSGVSHYTGRIHFGLWHRRMGNPDWHRLTGVFTPLVYVEFEVNDLPLDPQVPLHVAGETYLAYIPNAAGQIDRIVREGTHTILRVNNGDEHVIGRARLINMFTRYHPEPAQRRITELPPQMGLGAAPSRTSTLPTIDDLVPVGRRPDFIEPDARVWHYGQTDPNRHVTGMEYLRMMEMYIAEVLHRQGHDLRRLYFSRARIVYRKPCFRGETYRRMAWFRSEAPLTLTGAFYKEDDVDSGRPAVAIELTVSQHESE